MTTNGTIAIRRQEGELDEVFIFYKTVEGFTIPKFRSKQPNHKSIDTLIIHAIKFIASHKCNDITKPNVHVEPFDPEKDYSNMAGYSDYFDGSKWSYNRSG